MEYLTWGALIMIVILIIAFLDNSNTEYLTGRNLTGEEEAKKNNPFIK